MTNGAASWCVLGLYHTKQLAQPASERARGLTIAVPCAGRARECAQARQGEARQQARQDGSRRGDEEGYLLVHYRWRDMTFGLPHNRRYIDAKPPANCDTIPLRLEKGRREVQYSETGARVGVRERERSVQTNGHDGGLTDGHATRW